MSTPLIDPASFPRLRELLERRYVNKYSGLFDGETGPGISAETERILEQAARELWADDRGTQKPTPRDLQEYKVIMTGWILFNRLFGVCYERVNGETRRFSR